MNNSHYKIVAFFIIITILAGCSKLKDENAMPVSAEVSIHPAGFTNTSSADFHGKVIQKNNWNMTDCKKCHGGDYSGGQAARSCNSCHQSTPEACNTCHGNDLNAAPPNDIAGNTAVTFVTVGAHQAHLLVGDKRVGINCSECHVVPKTMNDAGHIDNLTGLKVYFNDSLANVSTKGRNKAAMTATLISNNQDIQCANMYCHGNFTNGNNYSPKWTKGPSEANCGTCHSIPPKAPHIQPSGPACYACHTETVDQNLNIINKTKHIDGKLEVFGTVRTDW
jgi:predicted CxxxxCH...CXXCH cytochrome family protein